MQFVNRYRMEGWHTCSRVECRHDSCACGNVNRQTLLKRLRQIDIACIYVTVCCTDEPEFRDIVASYRANPLVCNVKQTSHCSCSSVMYMFPSPVAVDLDE